MENPSKAKDDHEEHEHARGAQDADQIVLERFLVVHGVERSAERLELQIVARGPARCGVRRVERRDQLAPAFGIVSPRAG
jgi:hypothetical protein